MRKHWFALITAAVAAMAQTPARNYLNEGITVFRAARYPQAVDLFQEAVNPSPSDATAHLYLATAYMSQFIPGVESPDNLQHVLNAEREFLAVLAFQGDNMLP